MFAIVMLVFGTFVGSLAVLLAGLPVIVLKYFRLLPFDRRIWWVLASLVAYCIMRELIFRSYRYSPPTSAPDKFYFDVNMFGAVAGVVGASSIGFLFLCFTKSQPESASVNWWVAGPITCLFVSIALSVFVQATVPLAKKRTIYEKSQLQLAEAIKRGDAGKLERMLSEGAVLESSYELLHGISPIEYAILEKKYTVLRVLLDPPRSKPVKVRARRLEPIIKNGDRELLTIFLTGKCRTQRLGAALRASIAVNDQDVFRWLLDQGADPNANQGFDTPLTTCARFNRIEMAETLVAEGANVNQLHGLPDLNRGSTPLIIAVDRGHTDFANWILSEGADVNRTKTGQRSALQAACHIGDIKTVELLLEAGADVNYRSAALNQSALHWTLKKSHRYDAKPLAEETKAAIVGRLIGTGANPFVKDRHGNTPIDIARMGRLELVLSQFESAKPAS